jgi:hypothetical protein
MMCVFAEEERRLEEERKCREEEERKRREEEAKNRAAELKRLAEEFEASKAGIEAKAWQLQNELRKKKEIKDVRRVMITIVIVSLRFFDIP